MYKCKELVNDIKIDSFLDKLLEAIKLTTILNCKIEDSDLKERFLIQYYTIFNFAYDDSFEKYDFGNIIGSNEENYNEFSNEMSFIEYKFDKGKINNDFFKEMHSKLFKNSRFDKNGILIGDYKNSINVDEIKYYMDDLINFMNDDSLKIHNLIKCAIFYLQFQKIRPFEKGNEKLSRYLIPIYLYKFNIFKLPIFGMSYTFSIDKVKYLNLLENVQKIDINDWISFFLEKCIDQAKEYIDSINDFTKRYQFCGKIIRNKYNLLISEQLINIIFGKLNFTSSELVGTMNISNTQANRYLKYLVNVGILATDSKHRYKKYYLKELEGIFKYL